MVILLAIWTQGSLIQILPRLWIFKDDKNPQHAFF
jgi:hypothetical protein